eukprot:358401-Chlamydomonas_euryale.AAC.2
MFWVEGLGMFRVEGPGSSGLRAAPAQGQAWLQRLHRIEAAGMHGFARTHPCSAQQVCCAAGSDSDLGSDSVPCVVEGSARLPA